MRWMLGAVALAVSGMAAAPAWAQTADFTIGTVRYSVPIPAGYCLPSGNQTAVAQYAASLDKDNVTLVTLYSCGAKADPMDYIVLKTPATLVGTVVQRSDILNDATFATAEKPMAFPQVEQQLENSMSDVAGRDVQISMSIGARGHDDVCGYIGGSAEVDAGDTHHISAGACLTAIGERALSVNYYAPGNDPATPKRLMENARALALRITVRK